KMYNAAVKMYILAVIISIKQEPIMTDSFPRVALYLQDKHPLQEAIAYVQYAEARGFEAVWQAESRLVRDAIVPMAAYAATTKNIHIRRGGLKNGTRNASPIHPPF